MRAASDRCFCYHSPIGILKIEGDDEAVAFLHFQSGKDTDEGSPPLAVRECARQLDEYFSGKRVSFSLPFRLTGTDFQQCIWRLVAEIPFGKTASYLDLALKAGDKNLIRAVGGANGANPLPILIPCHRVIGATGALTGYAGGLWRKKWLLEFEMKRAQPLLFEARQEARLTSCEKQTSDFSR